MQEILRPSGSFHDELIFFIVLLSLCLLAYTRRYFGIRMYRNWQAFWNIRLALQLMREDTSKGFIPFAFCLLSAIMTSIAVYADIELIQPNTSQFAFAFPVYTSIAIALSMTWIRLIWVKLVQVFSGSIAGLEEYAYYLRVSFLVLGVILFLPVCLAVFGSTLFAFYAAFTLLLLIAIVQIVTWIRGFQFALSYHVPLYYLFFYICTLEILPVALVVKFFFT